MNNREYASIVCRELENTLGSIDEKQAEAFVELIDSAEEIPGLAGID